MKRKHIFAGIMTAAMVLVGIAGIGSMKAEAASAITAPDVTITAPVEGQIPAGAVLNSAVVSSAELTGENVTIDDAGGINGKLTANDAQALNVEGNTKLLMRFQMKSGKVDHIESIIGKMNKQFGVQIANMDSGGNPFNKPRISFYAGFKNPDNENSRRWAEVYYELPTDANDPWYSTWHDVVAYYDGSALKLYVDGVAGTARKENNQEVTGELMYDPDSIFTIGYNIAPDPADSSDPEGNKQKYFGELKDVGVYVGSNVPDTTWTGKTGSAITAALANKTSTFELKASSQESDCKVESTTWEPNESKFGRYGDRKVTVVLKAGTGNHFKEAKATLRTAQKVLPDAKVALSNNKTEMTITYTFKGEVNPKAELQEYLNSAGVKAAGTENKDANGVRKYTKDTWNTYIKAYDAANDLVKNAEQQQAKVYTDAKKALGDAIEGLLKAAEHCECALSEITGFDGKSFELYESEEIRVELGSGAFTYSGDCLVHTGAKPKITYELAGSPTGAVLEGNVLKLTADAASVQVRFTVTLGEQTKTAAATYIVVKKDVNTLRRDLIALMNGIAALNVGDYTADSWNSMKAVYDEARKLGGSAEAASYLKAYKDLSAAKAALVKKSAAAFQTPAAGQVSETSTGRYKIISVEKKTVKLIKAKAKKAKMGIAASISINGENYKVVEVGDKAFKGFKTLKQITLSKNIQTIGKQAFSGCKKLSKVIVKGTVLKKIKSGAFKGTSKKMTVTFKSKKVNAKKRAALVKKMKKAGMSKAVKFK